MVVFVQARPAIEIDSALQVGLRERLSPKKIYAWSLEQIAAGHLPGEDLFIGWSYRASVGPDVAIETTVYMSPENGTWFGSLTAGPQIAKAMATEQRLATLSGLPDDKYEVVLLSIPGLLSESFWLRPLAGGRDWVVPYDALAEEIQENRLYWLDDFQRILQPAAQKRLGVHEAPELVDFEKLASLIQNKKTDKGMAARGSEPTIVGGLVPSSKSTKADQPIATGKSVKGKRVEGKPATVKPGNAKSVKGKSITGKPAKCKVGPDPPRR